MLYFSSTTIVLLLQMLELSMFPHLFGYFVGPFLVLPFIAIISLKDKTIFPLFLATLAGLLFDANTGAALPVFTLAFLTVVTVSKIFLGRFLSYGEIRAYSINVTVGLAIIYGIGFAESYQYLSAWSWFLPILMGTLMTYAFLLLYLYIGRRYFSWIEKKTEERYR